MATTLSTIRTIGVPVTDQDAALAFFVETLGFAPGMDAELQPGFRWIEVAPPGSPVKVALVAASEAYPAGIDTGIRFVSTDAAAEHEAMTAAGSTSTSCCAGRASRRCSTSATRTATRST